MKIHKKNKARRMRGKTTHGWGFRKKHRGSGHRGGVGMAGTGKRADQKKTLILNLPYEYFGKDRALRKGRIVRKLEVINVSDIENNINSFINKGAAKKSGEAYEVNLEGYKILGGGEINSKMIIKASAASKSAIEKVKSKGGEIAV